VLVSFPLPFSEQRSHHSQNWRITPGRGITQLSQSTWVLSEKHFPSCQLNDFNSETQTFFIGSQTSPKRQLKSPLHPPDCEVKITKSGLIVFKSNQAPSKMIKPKKAEKIWSLASDIAAGEPTELI
jgi:hypothetical protein